jgi:hypothetical protein
VWWTFQEYTSSTTLLYFTDQGLFLEIGKGGGSQILSEGPAKNSIPYALRSYRLDYLELFTRRKFTHPTDRLLGILCILYAIYGNQIYYDMPLEDFDSAILWTPESNIEPRATTPIELFPTWSWTSGDGSIEFEITLAKSICLACRATAVKMSESEHCDRLVTFRWLPSAFAPQVSSSFRPTENALDTMQNILNNYTSSSWFSPSFHLGVLNVCVTGTIFQYRSVPDVPALTSCSAFRNPAMSQSVPSTMAFTLQTEQSMRYVGIYSKIDLNAALFIRGLLR